MTALPAGPGAGSGATVWLTGLSGSGKSTIAAALAGELEALGRQAFLLDGDELRTGLNADLGFSAADRAENVRRVGEVALLLARRGLLSLAPVISPYASGRALVRARHAEAGVSFVEVYVATSLEECERRDVKGLYARARRGDVAAFTGVSDPYEVPGAPELVLDTAGRDLASCTAEVLAALDAALALRNVASGSL